MLKRLKQKFINWLLNGVHVNELHIGRHSVVIDGNDITLPGTVDGVDLSAHAANASAHHTKTTAAGDITSGTFAEARIPAHMAKSKLAWTANKLLKGAGAGADPTEIDPGSTLTIAETQAYSGVGTGQVWTDLDLSGTVGANAALVLLKATVAAGTTTFAVRRNGDTDEAYAGQVGCSAGDLVAGIWHTFLVPTDSSGIIEWDSQYAGGTVTIDVIAYIK